MTKPRSSRRRKLFGWLMTKWGWFQIWSYFGCWFGWDGRKEWRRSPPCRCFPI